MKQPTRIGRPRHFETETALDAAIGVFWLKGFSGASLDDLTDAMQINRPSLYGAFGDKQALYTRALARYADTVVTMLERVLSDDADPAACVNRLFAQAIALYTAPAPEPRGCLLASAALEEAPQQPELRDAIRDGLKRVEHSVAAYLKRTGLTTAQAAATAALIVTFLYGVSARARLGVPAKQLAADARRFVATLAL